MGGRNTNQFPLVHFPTRTEQCACPGNEPVTFPVGDQCPTNWGTPVRTDVKPLLSVGAGSLCDLVAHIHGWLSGAHVARVGWPMGLYQFQLLSALSLCMWFCTKGSQDFRTLTSSGLDAVRTDLGPRPTSWIPVHAHKLGFFHAIPHLTLIFPSPILSVLFHWSTRMSYASTPPSWLL